MYIVRMTLMVVRHMEMEALEAMSYMQSLGLKVDESAQEGAIRRDKKNIGSKNNRRRNGQPLIDPGLAFTTPTQTYLTVSGATAAAALSNQNNLSSAGGAARRTGGGDRNGNRAGVNGNSAAPAGKFAGAGKRPSGSRNAGTRAGGPSSGRGPGRGGEGGNAAAQKPQQRRRRKAPVA